MYGELNVKVNCFVWILMDCGISLDDCVGVFMKLLFEMFVVVFGVLKVGVVFVLIDFDYLDQWIEYILQDSGVKFFLKQEGILVLDSYMGDVIFFDGSCMILSLLFDENDEGNLEIVVIVENLVYMIYMFGMIGQLKGVMVEYYVFVNLCFWYYDVFSMIVEDCSVKYVGFGFDVFIWEMFLIWMIGVEFYVIDEVICFDIVCLNDYFEMNGVMIMFLLIQFVEQFMEFENILFCVFLIGGDKLKWVVKKLYIFVNNYGLIENMVVVISVEIYLEEGLFFIGRVIVNMRVYIFGEGNQVQLEGVVGEFCVVGCGLVCGYLN